MNSCYESDLLHGAARRREKISSYEHIERDFVKRRRLDSAANLLASGYISTMLGIAALSLVACGSLLVTVKAISNLEPGIQARVIQY
jgi:hypothetical protein